MPDHFAILAQPRRPWLDPSALKEAFHRATVQHHPDSPGGSHESASALNAAYAVLREPATRLRHLLEIEWPDSARVPAAIAPEFADLFTKLATLRQTGAALAKKHAAAHTPLARALLAGDQAAHRREVEAALAALAAAEAVLMESLRGLDAAWDQRDDSTRLRLTCAQQSFAFLAKWQAQLREDVL